MGISKTEIFTQHQNEIAQYAKAFSHPARVAILQQLIKMEACFCGEFVIEIGLAQATISQHLKVLKDIGLIQGTIAGTTVCYCIDPVAWDKMKDVISLFVNENVSLKTMCCE